MPANSTDAVARIARASDHTLAAGSAHFRYQVTVAGQEFRMAGRGVVDFHTKRAVVLTHVSTGDDLGDSSPVELLQIVDGSVVYHRTGEGDQAEWVAVDAEDWMSACLVYLVSWLRGATRAEPAGAGYQVRLDLGLAAERAPDHERGALTAGLTAVGLEQTVLVAEVELDDLDRVRRMTVHTPAGDTPLTEDGRFATDMEIRLFDFGSPVIAPTPQAAQTLTITELLAGLRAEDDG